VTALCLERLALSHFRSHRRAVVDTDARPVAIYGPNGAGKTNLIEAISMLSPGRGMRRASAQEMTRRPEALGWKISALLRGPDGTHEIDIRSEAGGARQVEIDGKQAPQTALGRIARVLWLIPSMDRLWIESPEGRRRFLDRMTLSFFPDHAEVSLAYEKAMRERNRLLKDQVRDAHWYAALEGQMAQSGAAIQFNRQAALDRLARAQEGAETQFPAAELALVSTEAEIPDGVDDLRSALAEGRFRDDLYYRLNVVTIRIPPLRERRGDVPLLFAHFLERAAARFGRPVPAPDDAVHRHLAAHDWPGNVRELAHFAERVALGLPAETAPGSGPLPAGAAGPGDDPDLPLPRRVDRFEAGAIRAALALHDGEVKAVIQALGLPRKTFYDKLQRHGIDPNDYRRTRRG